MVQKIPTSEPVEAGARAMDPQLGDLVERTSGPQPLRRIFHALNGIVVASALTWLPISRIEALGALGLVLVALVTLDVARLRVGRLNQVFFRAFPYLLSPREARGVASSTWYTLGLIVTVAAFRRPEAVSGILVLALADPVASYGGRRWGKTPFLGASLEGSLMFLLVALLILGIRHPPLAALGAAVVATLAERKSWPLDDNFTVPVLTAAVVTLLEGVL